MAFMLLIKENSCLSMSFYKKVHNHVFSEANILSGFTAAGLVPFNPHRVLTTLYINTKTPTPPSSSSNSQPFYLGKTQANLYQLNQQKKKDPRTQTTISIL